MRLKSWPHAIPHSDNPVSQELGGQLQLVDLGKDFSRGNERLQESDI
jgi:hypothetical protein